MIRGRFVLLASCLLAVAARAEMIDGVVVDPDGKPVAGARISAHVNVPLDGDLALATSTDADGRYRLELPERASPRGVRAVAWTESLMAFGRGADLARLRMVPLRTVTGTATTPGGDPLAGAEVKAIELLAFPRDAVNFQPGLEHDSIPLLRSVTGPDGAWRIQLPQGWGAMLRVIAPEHGSRAFEVRPTMVGSVTVKVPRGGTVEVRMTDADGHPLPGVEIGGGRRRVFLHAVTDETGVARLRALPAGSVGIWVKRDSPAIAGAGASREAMVTAGEVTRLDWLVNPPATVTVQLSDAAGRPLPAIGLRARAADASWDVAVTDATGGATWQQPAGRVTFHAATFAELPLVTDDRLWEGELKAGEQRALALQWSPPSLVRGVVRAPSGEPVAEARVSLKELYWTAVRTDPAGEFKLPLPEPYPAELTLTADSPERSGEASLVRFGERLTEEVTIVLRPVQPVLVEGRVVDEQDRPMAAVAVRLTAPSPLDWSAQLDLINAAASVRTAANGTYVATVDPRASDVRATASREGYRQIAGGRRRPDDLLELEPVVLQKIGDAIVGLVVDEQGEPVSGATVMPVGVGDPELVTTDERGNFRIDPAPAGPVELLAVYGRRARARGKASRGGEVRLPLETPPTAVDLGRTAEDDRIEAAIRMEEAYDQTTGLVPDSTARLTVLGTWVRIEPEVAWARIEAMPKAFQPRVGYALPMLAPAAPAEAVTVARQLLPTLDPQQRGLITGFLAARLSADDREPLRPLALPLLQSTPGITGNFWTDLPLTLAAAAFQPETASARLTALIEGLSPDEDGAEGLAWLTEELVRFPELLAQAVAALEAREAATAQDRTRHLAALSAVDPAALVPRAESLLALQETAGAGSGFGTVNLALRRVVRHLALTDPTAALALAERLPRDHDGLLALVGLTRVAPDFEPAWAAVAARLSPDLRGPSWPRAVAEAIASGQAAGRDVEPWLAALAARQGSLTDDYLAPYTLAALALAPVAPNASLLWAEQMLPKLKYGGDHLGDAADLLALYLADPERADEVLDALRETHSETWALAQAMIANWLLTPAENRVELLLDSEWLDAPPGWVE